MKLNDIRVMTMDSKGRDGGDAILDALRKLGVDYIISSSGSEWPPVWEALTKQVARGEAEPRYMDCWHEAAAVSMAMGYAMVTGKLQAVLLHTSVGLLQGSIGIRAAYHEGVPMIVLVGETAAFGEAPAVNPGSHWLRDLSLVGGPERIAAPFIKWSSSAKSPHTLYQLVIRAGEIAKRIPQGPTLLSVPIEVMAEEWEPPARGARAPLSLPSPPNPDLLREVAHLLAESQNPVIITDSCGRSAEGFGLLVELSDLLSIPVVEGETTYYSNFPKDHPLHLGYDLTQSLLASDVFLVLECRLPWYPGSRRMPAEGSKVIVMGEQPIRLQMPYQPLHADVCIEGNTALGLRAMVERLKSMDSLPRERISERRAKWEDEHKDLWASFKEIGMAARESKPIDPAWLCTAVSDVMPQDSIFVDETIVHRPLIYRHVIWNNPQSYFRPGGGGLGLGLGLALGVKLALPKRVVVCLIGDGSFLYNPVLACLGASRDYSLPIMIVIFDNRSYRSMKRSHLGRYPEGEAARTGTFFGVQIVPPDYQKIAESCGGYGEVVEDPDMVRPVLERGLAEATGGRLSLIDVVLRD